MSRNWELKNGRVWSDDPYYSATDGGYIVPANILVDQELAQEVSDALVLVETFFNNVLEDEE